MTWIKICGITSRPDAEAITEMEADCMGFIFSTNSPRRIGPERAKEIVAGLASISRAGVFVNEKIDRIKSHVDLIGLDYVQLSGDEDISYMAELKKNIGRAGLIKALKLKKKGSEEMLKTAERYLEHADYLLLDSYDKDRYGGTGKMLDWNSMRGLFDPEKLIISGGLHSGNVSLALEILDPFGVDASSLLEVRPGIKDRVKVQEFIEAVRAFKRTG